jgi:hypothetical protein
MMRAPSRPSTADAAAQRARCHAAAVALQHTPRRAQLSWQDLAAWPAWASMASDDTGAFDTLAWTVGVHWYGRAWQRCIDGAQLQKLRQRLGAASFDALMAAEGVAADAQDGDAPSHPQGRDADAAITQWGKEVLLAALPAPALRVVLRETLWPHTLPPVPAPAQTVAQKVVVQALRGLPPQDSREASA